MVRALRVHPLYLCNTSRMYEEDPSVPLDFGRPMENIGLKHPDDPNVWCVVRAGYDITVVYDAGRNTVTFLNLWGMFNLRNLSPDLAQWAREAELVLPFTGEVLMRGICRAIYLPQDRKEPPLELEDDDIGCDLHVLPPESSGAGRDRDVDMGFEALDSGEFGLSSSNQSTSGKCSAQTTSHIPDFFDSTSTGRAANKGVLVPIALRSPPPKERRSESFVTFGLEKVKVVRDSNKQGVTYTSSADGTGDRESLELQLHDGKICVVKVCVCVCMCVFVCVHVFVCVCVVVCVCY